MKHLAFARLQSLFCNDAFIYHDSQGGLDTRMDPARWDVLTSRTV